MEVKRGAKPKGEKRFITVKYYNLITIHPYPITVHHKNKPKTKIFEK